MCQHQYFWIAVHFEVPRKHRKTEEKGNVEDSPPKLLSEDWRIRPVALSEAAFSSLLVYFISLLHNMANRMESGQRSLPLAIGIREESNHFCCLRLVFHSHRMTWN